MIMSRKESEVNGNPMNNLEDELANMSEQYMSV